MLYDEEKTKDILAAMITQLRPLIKKKKRILVAVDGRCAAGKTALTRCLQKELDCNVIHMDDFFLRPEQRSAERIAIPGENVDHERFLEEVIIPLKSGGPFSYRPFSCELGELASPVAITPKPLTIVEGAYSCHKDLWKYYDLHIFIGIDKKRQMQRIVERSGEEKAKQFGLLWIPLEERYITACHIKEKCELKYEI